MIYTLVRYAEFFVCTIFLHFKMVNMFLVILKFILMVLESRSSWQQFAFISKCPQHLLLQITCVCVCVCEGVYVWQLICGPAVLLLHINNDFFAISTSASVYLSVRLSICLSLHQFIRLPNAIPSTVWHMRVFPQIYM